MELAKGEYYFEEASPAPGIMQLINQVEEKVFSTIPVAGPSWRPEIAGTKKPFYVLGEKSSINPGLSMIGVEDDGSEEMLSAFCQASITGEKAPNIVEECYSSTILCLMGNEAIKQERKIYFPEEYKIPYIKF